VLFRSGILAEHLLSTLWAQRPLIRFCRLFAQLPLPASVRQRRVPSAPSQRALCDNQPQLVAPPPVYVTQCRSRVFPSYSR
jgi:hypothetical protein